MKIAEYKKAFRGAVRIGEIVFILPIIIVLVYTLHTRLSPPKIITENGHTYHLADENDVEKEIERNGYRYILADE